MSETQRAHLSEGSIGPPMESTTSEAAASALKVTCPPPFPPDARRRESKLSPLHSQEVSRSLFASLNEWPQVYDLSVD